LYTDAMLKHPAGAMEGGSVPLVGRSPVKLQRALKIFLYASAVFVHKGKAHLRLCKA
jgi:hypothetical protein